MVDRGTQAKKLITEGFLLSGSVRVGVNLTAAGVTMPAQARSGTYTYLEFGEEALPAGDTVLLTDEGILARLTVAQGPRVDVFVPWAAVFFSATDTSYAFWVDAAPEELLEAPDEDDVVEEPAMAAASGARRRPSWISIVP